MFDLPKRWAKCVAAGGAYFEGKGLDIPHLPEFLENSKDDWSGVEDGASDSDSDWPNARSNCSMSVPSSSVWLEQFFVFLHP